MKRFNLKLAALPLAALMFCSCQSRADWSEIFAKKGEAYAAKGKYDLALEEFEKANRIHPGNLRAYLKSAEIYAKLGKNGLVIESMNAAEGAGGEIPAAAYALKGDALVKDKQYFPALAAYEKAALLEPLNAQYQKLAEEMRKITTEIRNTSKTSGAIS